MSEGKARSADDTPLRIALVAPPIERVPPRGYGGTERVVHTLAVELHRRGHAVTLIASGDSEAPGELIPSVPVALRDSGRAPAEAWASAVLTQLVALEHADRFDVVHSHLDWAGLVLGHRSPVPVVATFHGRIDASASRQLLALAKVAPVAISRNQAATHPDVRWAAIVYNGLDLSKAPFQAERSDDLVFVGRLVPEKGIVEAIEVARLTGRRLRIVAKVGSLPSEVDYYERVVRPLMERADVEHLGELASAERDRVLAESHATLMPGNWPEPFGLVAIESLACGTPVLARRVGALPEIVRQDVDGYFGDDPAELAFHVDDVDRLDRAVIRASVLERFSAERMTDGYEQVYRDVVRRREAPRRLTPVGPSRPTRDDLATDADTAPEAADSPAPAGDRQAS